MALGILAAIWFDSQSVTITRTVTVDPPAGVAPVRREMRIRCEASGDFYVSRSGGPDFFNGSTGSPASPTPPCDRERRERRGVAIAITAVGVLLALGLVLRATVIARKSRLWLDTEHLYE